MKLLLDFKTVQISIFKILVDSLKEIVVETNIEFSKEMMRITKMDTAGTICVLLELNMENFKPKGYYKCDYTKENPLIVGINLLHLSKIFKTLNNDDILSFQIDASNRNIFKIKVENTNKLTITKYSLNLIEIDEEQFNFPDITFDSVINFNSNCFQKIIKDISNLEAKYIDIKSYNRQLIFTTGEDGFAKQETTIEDDSSIKPTTTQKNGKNKSIINFEVAHENTICQGEYQTKQLLSISKFTNLCDWITIKMKNDIPLTISFKIGILGTATIVIAPRAC